jgi:hypothetical protein
MTIYSPMGSGGTGNRILTRLFGLAAAVGIVCAIYHFLRSGAGEPEVIVEEPNRILNDLILEHDYDIAFRVHNRTERTLRIVGMGFT